MVTLISADRKVNKYIDYAGLYFIGLLALGFMLHYRTFAKLHITLPLINVPFFIGDMVFVSCFLLFCLKWLVNPKKTTKITRILLGYFIFVTIKTVWGYYFWGPLALRHAVMFYYPFFVVFAYSFYTPSFFSFWKRLVLIAIFLFIFKFIFFHQYYGLTASLLIIILFSNFKSKSGKLILFVLLVILLPYKTFFYTSRSFILGNVLAFTYMLCGALIIFRWKRIYKVAIFAFFTLLIIFGLLTMSDRNDIKSFIGFDALLYRFHLWEDTVHVNESNFIEPKLKVRLYNEKRDTFEQIMIAERSNSMAAEQKESAPAELEVTKRSDVTVTKEKSEKLFTSKLNSPTLGDIGAEKDRDINVSYANILFRVFIWRDALNDLMNKWPVFGFDFGKPFRSHSLEVLGWASTEWLVDGWVCLHNSYIDLIYRAGVTGLAMIVLIIFFLWKFTIVSLRKRSLTGILLTGILINWFIAANFLEILEMPYSAIPLWSLFGLNLAYLFKPEEK